MVTEKSQWNSLEAVKLFVSISIPIEPVDCLNVEERFVRYNNLQPRQNPRREL